jgi:protein-tyrosine phosphatase
MGSLVLDARSVLFLCTGNYYRSRYAEIIFNLSARVQAIPWVAESRGLAPDPGNVGPISSDVLDRLARRGLQAPTRIRPPMAVTEADLATADRVIALDRREHHPLISERFPTWGDEIEYWDVGDVYVTPPALAMYEIERQCGALLEALLRAA